MACFHKRLALATGVGLVLLTGGLSLMAQEAGEEQPGVTECTNMTAVHLGEIILRIDENAEAKANSWIFTIEEIQITLIYDVDADRMRIILPVARIEDVTPEEMTRIMQANFDSALDARYSLAQGILRSTFIHPLSPLDDKEFLSGIGQAVNLSLTFGTTYSSGALVFGGGDSQELLRRQLIDRLYEKGLPT